ncbi:PREDICTED: probable malonyl-CoA-acyl carrier protein transacylase, mitochondrial [Dufourea novaeangliae]|uniref:probable malonyl-CoA-acyl carrier protein transacylase, mitochondrial n=1 Tax=Dufourea novaeangliae TaxID=178035 RepID=UPI000766E236|nr:PREDICTED: probable malonyl-CoA-acyl carrier protein transacylase, mitochondrial [Dufourea novaeangliae]
MLQRTLFGNDQDNKSESTDEFVTNDESVYNTKHIEQLLNESATYKDINNNEWATTPYPADVKSPIEEKKPRIDPKDTCVLLFPGQGTIKVGMIKQYIHIPDARDLFEIANEILNYDLLKICLNGPQEKLDRTEFNQAATVVSSLAALEKLRERNPNAFNTCIATAGYSVGEITALILSGAITFEDGIRLVCVRGKAMQFASDRVPQGMLSVTCTPKAQLHKACTDAKQWAIEMGVQEPVCSVAIFMHTERKILAGNIEALQYIENNQKELGFSNVTRLPVSGAFHTPLMQPSLKSISEMLNSVSINEPRCQVYSNYKAQPYTNLRFMKKYILKQIISPIKWEQCMQSIYNRPPDTPFPKTYDVGSTGRMRTILKLINLKASQSCIVI